MASITVIPADKPCTIIVEGMDSLRFKMLLEKIEEFKQDYRYVSSEITLGIELTADGYFKTSVIGPKDALEKVKEKGRLFKTYREVSRRTNEPQSPDEETEHARMLSFFKGEN